MIPMCSKCKKRPAVVFITAVHGDEKKSQELCLVCAKELNVPQVTDYMRHLGFDSEEDFEMLAEQMMNSMGELGDLDGFEVGGANTMNALPPFIQNLFSC